MSTSTTPESVSAPGSTMNPRLLSDAGIVAVRSALQAQLRGNWPDGTLRQAIRLLCAEAHGRGLQVEQLLIALKQAWRSIPEAQRIPAGGPREKLLDRLVTMCIEEFYSDQQQCA